MDIPETTLKKCYEVEISRKSASAIGVHITTDTFTISAAEGAIIMANAGAHSCLLSSTILLVSDVDIFNVLDALRGKKDFESFITRVRSEDLDAALKPLSKILRNALLETVPDGYLREASDLQQQVDARVDETIAELRLHIKGEEARAAIIAAG